MTAPFEGVRVVEIAGDEVAYCGKLFANQGADVVLVEPPGGALARTYGPFADDKPDPNGSLHTWHYHTSKRSAVVDITTPAGRAVLLDLLGSADLLIESQGTGWMERNELACDGLLERFPSLVIGSVTPYGTTGPYANYAATDLTALSMGGLVHQCGYDDHSIPPIRPMGYQAWHTASHHLYIACMLALIGRQATGRGQHAEISMHEAITPTTEFMIPMWETGRNILQRQTGRHAYDFITEPAQFPTRDGYVYMLLKTDDTGWNGLVDWLREHDMAASLEGPQFEDRTLRQEQSAVVMPLMGAFAADWSAEEFYYKAQSIGQPWAMIRTPDEAVRAPHHVDRGFPQQVEHPERGRSYTYAGAPWLASATPYVIRRRAPNLGEHTAEVLTELGYDASRQDALRAMGVIA